MAQIFYQSFGQTGTLVIWSIVVVVQSVVAISASSTIVTNSSASQVHDGVKHGECCLHDITRLPSLGLTIRI